MTTIESLKGLSIVNLSHLAKLVGIISIIGAPAIVVELTSLNLSYLRLSRHDYSETPLQKIAEITPMMLMTPASTNTLA